MTVVGVAARCRPDVSYDRSECRKASTTDATRGRVFAIERIYADPHRWGLTVAATPPDAQSYIIVITLPVLLAMSNLACSTSYRGQEDFAQGLSVLRK